MRLIPTFLTFSLVFSACRARPIDDFLTLKIPLGSEPPVLDAQLADTGISVFILRQVLTTLFDYDQNQKIINSDAESYSWARDGHALKVKLRAGLKWSDGVALTACQYRDGILRALDPSTPAALADILYEIKGAKERKSGENQENEVGLSCDDSKAEINFQVITARSPKLLDALAFIVASPIRKDLVQARGSEWLLPKDGKPGVGLGAFQIEEWSHDRRVILTARQIREKDLPEDRRAGVNRVDLPIVRDPTTSFAMYNAGELDLVDEIPPAFLAKLKDRADVIHAPYFTTYMVGFSFDANPVLKDRRVREALAFTARQAEVPGLLGGGEIEAKGWIPPGLLPVEAQPTKAIYDPVQAKKLLDEAGYKDRSKFPILKLFFNSGERHQLLMERLAHNWKEDLGISVELDPIEWKVLVARLKVKPPDLYRYAWAAVYPDPLFFLELYLSDSANNFGHWKNKEFDSLVKQLGTVDLANRDSKFWAGVSRAQDILVREDPALIPIYHYVHHSLVKPYVHGLSFSGQGLNELRFITKTKP